MSVFPLSPGFTGHDGCRLSLCQRSAGPKTQGPLGSCLSLCLPPGMHGDWSPLHRRLLSNICSLQCLAPKEGQRGKWKWGRRCQPLSSFKVNLGRGAGPATVWGGAMTKAAYPFVNTSVIRSSSGRSEHKYDWRTWSYASTQTPHCAKLLPEGVCGCLSWGWRVWGH